MSTPETAGRLTALMIGALAAATPGAAASAEEPPCLSAPLAAVADRIAEAFDHHQFVFLGSTHGGAKRHQLLLCLLSRPGFQERVRDVLVEWANPVRQEVVDRYLLGLEEVPARELRRVWVETDGPELWGRLPLIPQFYAAVREINEGLPAGRRVRVLGGSEPVDWGRLASADDVASRPFKTNWTAHVVAEHFAADAERPLLVVYGDGHIHHAGGTLMSDIEAVVDRSRLFVVGTVPDLGDGERDVVARLGPPERPFFLGSDQLPGAGPYPSDLFYAGDGPLAQWVDAVAYLGPTPDASLAGQIELTAEERAAVAERQAIVGDRRRAMELRFRMRDRWFASHPDDLPLDPRP